MMRIRALDQERADESDAVRTSLGLVGDLDVVELLQDVEQAFGVRLPDEELSGCRTIGDLFELVGTRLPLRTDAERCATAMCFYRVRRAILALAPDVRLRPSMPIDVLKGVSVKSLYKSIEDVGGLRSPSPYISSLGGVSLLLAVAAPVGLTVSGAPWWATVLSVLVAITAYRLSPMRLPSQVQTVHDLVELVATRNVGALIEQGARLRPAEAWKALQTICADHAPTTGEEIGNSTLIYARHKAVE